MRCIGILTLAMGHDGTMKAMFGACHELSEIELFLSEFGGSGDPWDGYGEMSFFQKDIQTTSPADYTWLYLHAGGFFRGGWDRPERFTDRRQA